MFPSLLESKTTSESPLTATTTSMNPFDSIPIEHLVLIIEFLPIKNRCDSSALVSKIWCEASKDDSIWQLSCLNAWNEKKNFEKLITMNETETWKKRYFLALRDSKRNVITEDELYQARWCFQAHSMMALGFAKIEAQWTKGRLHVATIGSFPWKFLDRKQDGKVWARQIQVDHFPPLTLTRTDDWGWRFYNHYVVFLSMGSEDQIELSLDIDASEPQESFVHVDGFGMEDDSESDEDALMS